MKKYIKSVTIPMKDFLMILLGVALLAIGVAWFLAPLGLVTGGISGIAILVEKISSGFMEKGLPIWLTNAVLNIPLFVVSIRQRGFGFAKKSLYAVVLFSSGLALTEFIPNPLDVGGDLLLASIFGGIFVGLGVGLVLRAGGTTGGTDMLAAIFKFKSPNLPIDKVMLAVDSCIVISGLVVFGVINVMYAVLSVVVTAKMVGLVLEGGSSAKAAFIISDHHEAISDSIMGKMDRGSTGLKATGMYSKRNKEMLFVVTSPKQLPQLRQIVMDIDPMAFVTIADVREVLGHGFVEDYDPLKL
ncbi:MAG: YitT family protein [Proteocatella sp.]